MLHLNKTSNKYEDRGYKLIHLDMGHLSQNLYLLSSAQQLGIRAIFGLYENKVNEFLEIDGENEFVLLSHVLRNKVSYASNYGYKIQRYIL